MKIKVCGMKYPDNMQELAKLPVDMMGLIFYHKSPRFINNLDIEGLNLGNMQKVGVFVDEDTENIYKSIDRYKLNYVQLHGSESEKTCEAIKIKYPDLRVIKAFNVSEPADFGYTEGYEDVCDYFLFDTKTSAHGGSGKKFDWNILDSYKGKTPFFLSGGISVDDVESIKSISHPKLYALDLNSKFEVRAGEKNIELLNEFLNNLKL